MKAHLITVAALSLAGAAQAQSAPPAAQTPPPSNPLTRDLNSGPPAPAAYIAPAPAPSAAPAAAAPNAASAAGQPVTAPAPAVSGPPAAASPATVPPASTPARAVSPAPVASVPATPARANPAPAIPAPATPAPARPASVSAVPAPAPATPPPPPAVPVITVLDTAARAALPFSVALPAGFEIVTGRPGPDFRIYTIRRGQQSFVMVYAGPASQFPIYSGEVVEAGGRNSVIATEGGVRHAMEHLFQRAEAPREIHVWTMSLDGPDRTMAELIAQSIDIR